MVKNKKIVFAFIIILLVICLPISIFSTILHFKEINNVLNPNHEFKYDNYLYFYNSNDELVGTYECTSSIDKCDYATSSLDLEYDINEAKETSTLEMVDDRYVFINDNDESKILLYDLTLNRTIGEYQKVKNYGVGIEDNTYILQNKEGLWGVVQFNSGIRVRLPFQYNFIGLLDNREFEDDQIKLDYFITLQNASWQLINIDGNLKISDVDEQIIGFNQYYVILLSDDKMSIIDYNKNNIMANHKYLEFYEDYVMAIDNYDNFYLYDIQNKEKISDSYKVSSILDVKLTMNGNKIIISINDEEKETVEI